MKIRSGWVSNSSSSSFVGIGWKLDVADTDKIKKLCYYAGCNFDDVFCDPDNLCDYDAYEHITEYLDAKNHSKTTIDFTITEWDDLYLYYSLSRALDKCSTAEEYKAKFNSFMDGIDPELCKVIGKPTFMCEVVES